MAATRSMNDDLCFVDLHVRQLSRVPSPQTRLILMPLSCASLDPRPRPHHRRHHPHLHRPHSHVRGHPLLSLIVVNIPATSCAAESQRAAQHSRPGDRSHCCKQTLKCMTNMQMATPTTPTAATSKTPSATAAVIADDDDWTGLDWTGLDWTGGTGWGLQYQS